MRRNIFCNRRNIDLVAFPRGLFVEFESGVSEELVGCGGGGEHAIFVKIIVALLTSVSLSEAMHGIE
jgi:hypothetical protein